MGRLRAFSGNPYMTVHSRPTGAARPPSWFEPESSDLIGRAPAKASSHWFPHSLSSLARLEGTLQCWLVALNRPEKKASVSKVWGKQPAGKSAKASRVKRASRGEDELDEGANGAVRVQQVLHQAPLRGAEPGPAAVQGEPQTITQKSLILWAILSNFEKYADPVYKSSCVALTVKIGRLCNWADGIAETAGFFKRTNSLLKRLFTEFLFYLLVN